MAGRIVLVKDSLPLRIEWLRGVADVFSTCCVHNLNKIMQKIRGSDVKKYFTSSNCPLDSATESIEEHITRSFA